MCSALIDSFPDLLMTESVVFWFSLWTAFAWAVLYLTFSSIPLVFETNHHFNNQEVGAVFGGEMDLTNFFAVCH